MATLFDPLLICAFFRHHLNIALSEISVSEVIHKINVKYLHLRRLYEAYSILFQEAY
jgi:hypothetical protein